MKASTGQSGLVPVQLSGISQRPAAGRQTVVVGAYLSGGHAALTPSQTSGTSHRPTAKRQRVPAATGLPAFQQGPLGPSIATSRATSCATSGATSRATSGATSRATSPEPSCPISGTRSGARSDAPPASASKTVPASWKGTSSKSPFASASWVGSTSGPALPSGPRFVHLPLFSHPATALGLSTFTHAPMKTEKSTQARAARPRFMSPYSQSGWQCPSIDRRLFWSGHANEHKRFLLLPPRQTLSNGEPR